MDLLVERCELHPTSRTWDLLGSKEVFYHDFTNVLV